ncbi:uncharacterized protein LOC116255024 [Nymphaea colorata]|nr:uncharacterized protein LOC116255024 [Nymphaea colorata]
MTGSESSGKRSRDPEDAVYLDNFHSHKRYLSEMMACSLNGLTVGDSLAENHRTSPSRFDPLDSPARSETIGYSRDELCSPYSPMSEDSDDSRCCEPSLSTSIAQTDSCSRPTSPVSPCRHHHRSGFGCTTIPTTFTASSLCIPSLVMGNSQQRQRNTESEGRFPSSPSDICHSPDLRRAALLRSVQMKAQPQRPLAFELQFGSRPAIQHFEEIDNNACSFAKPMVDERGYPCGSATRSLEHVENLLLEDCSSSGIAEGNSCHQKCYRRINLKDDAGRGVKEPGEEVFEGNVQTKLLSGGKRSVLGHAKACSAYK